MSQNEASHNQRSDTDRQKKEIGTQGEICCNE